MCVCVCVCVHVCVCVCDRRVSLCVGMRLKVEHGKECEDLPNEEFNANRTHTLSQARTHPHSHSLFTHTHIRHHFPCSRRWKAITPAKDNHAIPPYHNHTLRKEKSKTKSHKGHIRSVVEAVPVLVVLVDSEGGIVTTAQTPTVIHHTKEIVDGWYLCVHALFSRREIPSFHRKLHTQPEREREETNEDTHTQPEREREETNEDNTHERRS
jgi:hypothetical protein